LCWSRIGLILERRSPTATLAWLLALLFMPYFGFICLPAARAATALRRRRRRYGRARDRLIQSTHAPGWIAPRAIASGFPGRWLWSDN
jgi:hypothetical protein